MTGSAILSPCGRYRLRLDRVTGDVGPVVAIIGVNPSTADASKDDPTIRKDIGFATRLGWSRIIKANLCGYRATDVRELAAVADPVGPDTDLHLLQIMTEADVIVAAWGRDVYHLRGDDPLKTICGRSTYGWSIIGEIPKIDWNCCVRCAASTKPR